ncbi:MAG: hypothetical protein JNL97_13695, partial [Verrucomicrobiales bacterium]|nr:hypothetical protein [Verrucomicrobiales bacterium]
MQPALRLATLVAALGLLAAPFAGAQDAAAPKPVTEGTPTAETPDAQGWHRLFDGKTLSGWSTFDPGGWSIDAEGHLVGK